MVLAFVVKVIVVNHVNRYVQEIALEEEFVLEIICVNVNNLFMEIIVRFCVLLIVLEMVFVVVMVIANVIEIMKEMIVRFLVLVQQIVRRMERVKMVPVIVMRDFQGIILLEGLIQLS